MAYPSFIGWRYLRAKKKSSISTISLIAILGVAIGVTALSIVISISSGFEDEFTNKVLGVNAHVLVMKYGVDFTEYRGVMQDLQRMPEVRGVAPFLIQEMMMSKDAKTSGVLLKGVDPERIGTVLDLPRYLTAGGLEGLRVPGSSPSKLPVGAFTYAGAAAAPPEPLPAPDPAPSPKPLVAEPLPGIVLGATLAENLGAKVGDVVQVTTPLIGLDVLGWAPSDSTPRTLAFQVVGVFYAGFLEYDTKLAYVDYYQAQRFFDHGDSVMGLELTIHDTSQAKLLARRISDMLGGPPYHTTDWQLLNESLFRALSMQKVVLVVVFALVVLLAVFNIIATLVMMVFDKRREIAILKSMGATHGGIMRIFLVVGTVVGVVGIAIGLFVGLGLCLWLDKIGWPLDPKVYLIDHLPVRLEVSDFVFTAIVAFAICLLATLAPSWSASRLKPVDGLRQD